MSQIHGISSINMGTACSMPSNTAGLCFFFLTNYNCIMLCVLLCYLGGKLLARETSFIQITTHNIPFSIKNILREI